MQSLRDYISYAEKKQIAIGHFNISNLEILHGIFNAARELNLPVIIGTSEGESDFIGIHEAVALVQKLREVYDYPIFINADHCYSFEKVKKAIDAGYDAVIFDGAKVSHEENIEITKKCVQYARKCGRDVLVEAELGNIGQSSKLLDEVPEGVATDEKFLTSAEEAESFVKETGIDLLAPAVGNMHGMLKEGSNPKIDTNRIKEIRRRAGVPLVLHGGSGISDEDFVASIKAGICIIHINTEIRVVYREALEKTLTDNLDEVAPYKYLNQVVDAIRLSVKKRLKLFNDL